MENKIPTLEELNSKISEGEYTVDDDYLTCVISIVTIFSWFNDFLIVRWYDEDYELSTVIYWELVDYIKEQYDFNNIKEINSILSFLEILAISNNDKVLTLLITGFLENLDNYKGDLSDIIDLMPKNLKELFLRNFSNYLLE